MNWITLWIFMVAAVLFTPREAYSYEGRQYDAMSQAIAPALCPSEGNPTDSNAHQATWRWHNALQLDDDWRAQCRDLYTKCKNQNWGSRKGWNCHECFRNCEGQQEWPFDLCAPSIKQTQPKSPPKRRRR
jgi:hypothetical protein